VRFTHEVLARHPGLWRVDGIGPIEFRGRLGTRTAVYFSGLKEMEGRNHPYRRSSLSEATLRLPIHSASLREFKIGSIWQDGKRVAGPERIESLFRIDVSQVRLVTLEQAVKLHDQWAPTVVPSTNLYFGENRAALAPTLYAIVPVLGDTMTQWLVVPTSELLRFYAGVSSRFLSSALQGRLDQYVDWGRCRMEYLRPIIHVKQRISRKEAAVLARAVASPEAKAALLGPHQHLASIHTNNAPANQDNRRPLVIKAGFPFVDSTQLRVCGKRMPLIKRNGREQWAVFAMEILVCTHSPGFSGLVLESDDPFGHEGQSGGAEGDILPPLHQPLLDDEEDEYELEDVSADQRLARLVVRSYSNQFSAFKDLEIEHRRPRGTQGESRPAKLFDVPVDALTLGDGSYSNDSRGNLGISDFQSQVAQVDRDLSLFLEMLDHMRSATRARNWRILTRKLNDGLAQDGELIAVFPQKVGKRRTWHKIVDPNGNERTRQVVWVEVVPGGEGQYFYLLEMELKPGETAGQCTLLLHKHDFSRLEDETFAELLVLTAVQNRWPNHHNKWPTDYHYKRAQALFSELQLHRINHPSAPRQKDVNTGLAGPKSKLNPASWSSVLLTEMDEQLSYQK